MQLSPDGRETLEDALRIFTETAGTPDNRGEREDLARALMAELREPEPTPAWFEPTIAKVREANEYLASRAAPGLTRSCVLLDELQNAAGALVDEIATRRAVTAGELGVGALLTLKQPPESAPARELEPLTGDELRAGIDGLIRGLHEYDCNSMGAGVLEDIHEGLDKAREGSYALDTWTAAER